MSNFPSNTPIKVQVPAYEYSNLRPMRDKGSPYTLWKNTKDHAKAINALIDIIVVLQDKVKEIREPRLEGMNFFPFMLYNAPSGFYPESIVGSYDPKNNWRTFFVRAGSVLTKYEDSRSYVTGSDNINGFVDYDIFPNFNTTYNVLVPISQSAYYFWIHTTTGSTETYIIQHGSNPLNSGTASVGSFIPWTSWPSASNSNILIGYVDTLSSASFNHAYVRQYLRTDVISTGGGGNGNYIPMSVCTDQQIVTYMVDAFLSGSS